MKTFRILLAVTAASGAIATGAHAQSTGSVDFDSVIIVTGSRVSGVGGVSVPDSPKAKVEIGQELISRQASGQTINEILNFVPGVSFTNNDPWGSLGGSFTIRGFGSDRISQTVDGIPLNDSGNYALYTNQMLDPEIIESATVSLGSTDVDSPTASAAGGTINLRSRAPSDTFGVRAVASYGNIIARGNEDDRNMVRGFVMVDTGDITGLGTTAWFTASATENKSTFSNYGGVNKQQYNAKILQDLGSNGDFISIRAHYNQNRNNFNGSPFSFSGDIDAWLSSPDARFYDVSDGTPCTVDAAEAGVQDGYNSCGTPFERRFNPSNTGNVGISSRFTLTDGLVLNVEPSYQYVKANGGGTSIGYEGFSPDGYTGGIYQTDSRNPQRNNRSTTYYYFGGTDLNGDGDTLDFVNILSPSNTVTHRVGVIANLAWEINDTNRVRLAYTFDRAKHRQTGTAGLLANDGAAVDVFPINDPLLDSTGVAPQKRNRLSYAILNQISGEYRGSFLQDDLVVQLGARVPFFKRELNNYCVTTDGSGNVNCINGDADTAAYVAANASRGYVAPTSRDVTYNMLLPNVGMTYKFTPSFSIFSSYAKNLSVPGTDALYSSIYFDAAPKPETSHAFDTGLRFQNGKIQAQATAWYNRYYNRLASAYDINCDCTVTRNLGRVDKYGVDGSIAYQPMDSLLVYVFGSYLKSEIKEDVQTGGSSFAATAGKREAGAPKYSFGARAQGSVGIFDLGAQVKRTGSRYLNDINTVSLPAYTVVDLDIRVKLEEVGLKNTYFQLNLTNLFDEVYIGSASTGLTTSSGFVNIGSPRAIMGTLSVGF